MDSRVESFPRVSLPVLPIITPLWTDTYELYGIYFWRITYNDFELFHVKEILLDLNPDLMEFDPSVAVIVTWHDLLLLPDHEFVSTICILLARQEMATKL